MSYNHAELPDEILLDRLTNASVQEQFLMGERKQQVAHEVACIIFELSLRNGFVYKEPQPIE